MIEQLTKFFGLALLVLLGLAALALLLVSQNMMFASAVVSAPQEDWPPIARGIELQSPNGGPDRAFDEVLNRRFPIGSSAEALEAELARQNFTLAREGEDAPHAYHNAGGLPCNKSTHVIWRSNGRGQIAEISGSRGLACL